MLYFIYFLFYIISNNTETLLQLGNASLTRTFLIETSHYRLSQLLSTKKEHKFGEVTSGKDLYI